MTSFARSFIAVLLLFACGQIVGAADEKSDYFVFLVTGKSTQGTAPEDIQKMQASHLDNFRRLAKLGELSAAGPCADPDKIVRGIVVINATSLADAESKFGVDPYVSEGFMKTEIHPYQCVAGKLVIPAETTKMESSVIVIFSQDEKWPVDVAKQRSIRDQLAEFAKKQYTQKKLGVAALFGEQANNKSMRIASMIFRGEDLDTVRKLVGELESVSDKSLRVQVFAQYLVKDAMPSE